MREKHTCWGVLVGYAVVVVVGLAVTLVFALARDFFLQNAHYTAAILIFLCILFVAWINALGLKAKRSAASARNRYAAIGAAMVVAALVDGGPKLLGGKSCVLGIEIAWIFLFAIFRRLQTNELRDHGSGACPSKGDQSTDLAGERMKTWTPRRCSYRFRDG